MNSKPKFAPHDLAGDQNDRGTVAVRFVEAVDEVETSRTTASRHRGKAIQKQRLSLSRKCARLLMAHVNEFDAALGERGGEGIQGVADNPVTMLDTRLFQRLDDDVRDLLAH